MGIDNSVSVKICDAETGEALNQFDSMAKCSRSIGVNVKMIRNRISGHTKTRKLFSPTLNKFLIVRIN